MNILITAGTTPFDSLFKILDGYAFPSHFELIAQTGASTYIPRKFKSFEFSEKFSDYIDWADAVITHAGAGTVFTLLECGKKCLVVANLERVDKHQQELASFVQSNGYGFATEELEKVPELVLQLPDFSPKTYQKTDFFLTEQLSEIILSCY